MIWTEEEITYNESGNSGEEMGHTLGRAQSSAFWRR